MKFASESEVDELRNKIINSDETVSYNAVESITHIQLPSGVFLKEKDALEILFMALEENIHTNSAVKQLEKYDSKKFDHHKVISLLDKESRNTRKFLSRVVSEQLIYQAKNTITNLLMTDDDFECRIEYIKTLGIIGDISHIAILEQFLTHNSELIYNLCTDSIKNIESRN